MAQRLVIVSRDRADQFERFSGASVHRTNVQVIADRRRTERRQRNVPVSIERRRGDQRRGKIDNFFRPGGLGGDPPPATPPPPPAGGKKDGREPGRPRPRGASRSGRCLLV